MTDLNIGEIYATALDTTFVPIPGDPPDNWETLVDLIKDRIIASKLLSVDYVSPVLRKIVDRDGVLNAPQHIDPVLDLANGSHLLDDNALQASTGCVISNQQEVQQVENGARFYIRSLTLTAGQLRAILLDYEQHFADTILVDAFREQIVPEQIQDAQPVYVRYVGCTEARTPVALQVP